MDVPYNQSIFGSDSLQNKSGHLKLASSLIEQPSTTLLTAGVIRDGAIHLSQIQDILQIRPAFQGSIFRGETVEDMDENERTNNHNNNNNNDNNDNDNDDMDVESKESKKSLQQVQMRRKETEKSANSRLHSYVHHKTKEESEPWMPLEAYGTDSIETEERFEHLYHHVVIATEPTK